MSNSRLIPLSQILAEILTEDQPQLAVRAGRVSNLIPLAKIPSEDLAKILPEDLVEILIEDQPQLAVRANRVSSLRIRSPKPIKYFDDDVNYDFLPSELNGDRIRAVRCYMPLANVPKLTNMAASTVAVALWNHVNVTPFVTQCETLEQDHSYLRGILEKKILELVKQLRVPKLLLNIIEKHITEAGNELAKWVTYHHQMIPQNRRLGCWLFNLISRIVWRSDGIIDRLQTAKNVLKIENLADNVKYYLSSAYCLKDNLDSIPHTEGRTLESFWKSNLAKSLAMSNTEFSDTFAFKKRSVHNWPAKEYFFDRMTRQEQIENTIAFIDSRERSVYQKLLLMKLDDIQKTHVYAERIVKIISNYCRNRVDVREIYSIWPQVRDTITFDDFVGIYKCLFESRFVGVTLLKFIWSSTFEDFKNNFRYHNGHEMIDLALCLWNRNNQNDFIFTIMSNASANLKRDIMTKPFFTECCVRLICDDRLPSFNRLLRFCTVNLEDTKPLKRDIFKKQLFTDHCSRLLNDGKLSDLDQLIESIVVDVVSDDLQFNLDLLNNSKVIKDYCIACYSDGRMGCLKINKLLTTFLPSSPDSIAEFKRNLLMSSDGIDKCVQLIDSKTNLVPLIITDSLPTNDLVTKFHERLVFSPVAVNKLRNLIKKQRLSDANQYIDHLVKEEDRITLKKRIIAGQVAMIRKMFLKFDDSSWESLLMWLVPTEQALDEFKSEIPLDEVFNEMIKDCIFSKYDPSHDLRRCRLRDNFSFDSLNRFLNWYFESDETKIKEYKLRRIDSYGEIDAINTVLKSKYKGNARAVFDWIFKNDADLLAKFKAKMKDELSKKLYPYSL